ncbi:MAG: DUF4301 family protein [Deltaproteobacteria bacterium]|nr:DUF4301 family protein [Deltaproteobacteria bacterium]
MFNERDIEQIKKRGMTPEKVLSQIEIFKRGFPHTRLHRPCTTGDGITVLDHENITRLTGLFMEHLSAGRMMKFVPASGAASRMFKTLLSSFNRPGRIDIMEVRQGAENNPEKQDLVAFFDALDRFAFYDDLKSFMSRKHFDIDRLLSEGDVKPVLECIVTAGGLNLANRPKGLIPFHRYPDGIRTPFEEHLVEAAIYTRDRNNACPLHFTVSPEHQAAIESHIRDVIPLYRGRGIEFKITFSVQDPSTDTVAVVMTNEPFRLRDGRLLFRPGGHGALLHNLNALHGDIVFIKNIDNVVPDRIKQDTFLYKKALGGYLIDLQNQIFGYLERLHRGDMDRKGFEEIFDFSRHYLAVAAPENIRKDSQKARTRYLFSKLNRPLRVCGMVENVAEPGGGPFWTEHDDGSFSLQIVESAQVDLNTSGQRQIWESSTHFNPVDLVCGLRNYRGKSFDLARFLDPDTGFISLKSKEGRELKGLEHPGLWNGSMAHWNTAFIEVPRITFNPVKTVLDLLRKEHQPD